MNHLFLMALKFIPSLVFSLVADQFRYRVFSDLPVDDWNYEWWALREKYEGLTSPVTRPAECFDAGAKYHIPNNLQFIGYVPIFIIMT